MTENIFKQRLGHHPAGHLAEVDDELRDATPPGCLIDLLGIELTHAGPGAARALMPVHEKHLNQAGVVQAGALFVLADATAGWAAKTATPDGRSFVTVELNANVMRASVPGETLAAVASPVQLGRTVMVIGVEVRRLEDGTGDDKLVAMFRCTELVL